MPALLVVLLLVLTGCSTVGTRQRGDTDTDPRYLKARTLMEQRNYARALPILKEIVSTEPGRADAAVNLAIAYRESGQTDSARQVLEDVVAANPNYAAAHNQLGIVERQLGHFDEALVAYRHAIAIDGGYALAHRNLGILYDLYLQNPGSALNQYQKYLELAGNDDEVSNWIIDLKRRIEAQQESKD